VTSKVRCRRRDVAMWRAREIRGEPADPAHLRASRPSCSRPRLPVKVVGERLGHTKIAMTLDVYAHVLPAMDRAAATDVADHDVDAGLEDDPWDRP
jgi:integrase